MANVQIDDDAANIAAVNFINGSTDPSAPMSGHGKVYLKDGVVMTRLDTGDPTAVGGAVALPEGQLAVGDASGVASALDLGTEGDVVTADATGKATWATPAAGGGGGGGDHFNIDPLAYDSYVGTAPKITGQAASYHYAYVQATTPAQNDAWTYKLSLSAGTYSLRLIGVLGTLAAIVTIKLDGSTIDTWDMYSGSTNWAGIHTATGIVVAASGLKALSLSVPTRNGSATSWTMYLSSIFLWRTA